MASQKNPQQIIRKDGSNCFVEVMNNAFAIEKVQFNFYTYDSQAQTGSKLQNGISIYMSFEEFYRICHDITVTRALLNEILKLADDAKREGKKYAPTKTIHMGGRSAESLSRSGQARPDNMSLSRQLKIQAGSKYPVILIAESGPGEQDAKGLIVPRYQQPESRVVIPFTYESIKELFLITKAHLDAYMAATYTYKLFHPNEVENKSNWSNNRSNQQGSTTYQKKNYNNNNNVPPPPPPPPEYYGKTNEQSYPRDNANNTNRSSTQATTYNSQGQNSYNPPPPDQYPQERPQYNNGRPPEQQRNPRAPYNQQPPPPPPDPMPSNYVNQKQTAPSNDFLNGLELSEEDISFFKSMQ